MKKNDKKTKEAFAAVAINALSYAVNGCGCVTVENDFDWDRFMEFCFKHQILNIVYYGLKKADISIPDKIIKFSEEYLLRSMLKEAQRSVENDLLSGDLEKNEIPHMFLKGSVIKNIYPEAYLRSMGDVDILTGEKTDDAAAIAVKHGFTLNSKEFLHYSLSKNNLSQLELHKSLVDESIEKYYKYFGIGFERAKLCDGCKYKYELSDEDFYIFLIAHMAKHYEVFGMGIRSVCDVFVYNKTYKNLDRKYISDELEKIGLTIFENKIKSISENWFSGKFNGDFDAVGEYIISDGVFGSVQNPELNKFIINESESQNKYKYILKNIFPNKEYMCIRYPFLKKLPFLIPIFWIVRIIYTLLKSRVSIRYRLNRVSTYKKEYNKRFEETGLK